MSYNLSNRSKTRLKGVHPFLMEVFELGIKDSPYDFGIPQYGGLRTSKDQRELYNIGRTVDVGIRKPVTYTDGVNKVSNHQIRMGYGWAGDIYIYINGRASWNVDKLQAVAEHLINISEKLSEEKEEYKDLYLSWGGFWTKFKDYPHFEIKTK